MFYAAFGAEILRIDWMASNELISWITVQLLIVEWITKQEMSSPFPRPSKTFGRHFETFRKQQ